MPKRELSSDLAALVCHVGLHQSGWWTRSSKAVVLHVLRQNPGYHRVPQLQKLFGKEIGTTPTVTELTVQLEELEADGRVVRLDGEKFKISEQASRELDGEYALGTDLENYAQAAFCDRLVRLGTPGDPAKEWERFKKECLVPLIKEIGANTYTLVTGTDSASLTGLRAIDAYLDNSEDPDALLAVVASFLDPADSKIRNFVLSYLNSYYFLEASSLSTGTLKALDEVSASRPALDVFVDTNFIFSLLSLHNNPADDSSDVLLSLSSGLKSTADIRFWVLPQTVEEARQALRVKRQQATAVRWSRDFVGATLQADPEGIMSGFLREYVASNGSMTPEVYFDVLDRSLVEILDRHGIHESELDVDDYSMKQPVIDDIMEQLERQKKKPLLHPKGYESLRHDMVLWHVVRDLRSPTARDFVDAQYWVLTIDLTLINFDKGKQRRTGKPLPICMHPSTLAQVLQFWVPRSLDLEQAVVGSLKLPFLLKSFDVESERVTLEILRTLSAYEGAEDLSEETIVAILTDRELRARMSKADAREQRIEVVRDGLMQQLRESEDALSDTTSEVSELKRALREKDDFISGQSTAIKRLKEQVKGSEAGQASLQDRVQKLEKVIESLSCDRDASRGRLEELESKDKRRRFEQTAAIAAIGALAVTLVVGAVVARTSLSPAAVVAIDIVTAIVWAVGLPLIIVKAAELDGQEDHWLHVLLLGTRRHLSKVLLLVALAVAGNAASWVFEPGYHTILAPVRIGIENVARPSAKTTASAAIPQPVSRTTSQTASGATTTGQ